MTLDCDASPVSVAERSLIIDAQMGFVLQSVLGGAIDYHGALAADTLVAANHNCKRKTPFKVQHGFGERSSIIEQRHIRGSLCINLRFVTTVPFYSENADKTFVGTRRKRQAANLLWILSSSNEPLCNFIAISL